MSLEDLRRKIDETDARIIRLIGERIRIAEEIGQEKKKQNKQIEDREREEKVLEHVRSIAQQENIGQEDVERIYQQIIAMSKRTQAVGVAFQGEIGAYSEEASRQFFGPSLQSQPY